MGATASEVRICELARCAFHVEGEGFHVRESASTCSHDATHTGVVDTIRKTWQERGIRGFYTAMVSLGGGGGLASVTVTLL